MEADLKDLIEEVGRWDGVSRHPHRFGGEEFRLGTAELGHVHPGGVIDIPLPVALREGLVSAGHAERHHVLPASGWTTVRLTLQGTMAALKVLRLSYLRQKVRQARGTPEQEVLTRELAELERQLLPKNGADAPDEGLSAGSVREAGGAT